MPPGRMQGRGKEEHLDRDTEWWISEEEWRWKKRKKRSKRMMKAEVGFESEEDDHKNGDGGGKRRLVLSANRVSCAPDRVLEVKWKGKWKVW